MAAISVQTASDAGRRMEAAEAGTAAPAPPEDGPAGEGAPAADVAAAPAADPGDARAYRDAAVMAILLAMIANTFAKGCLAAALGSGEFRRRVLPVFGALTGVGILLALFA